MVPPRPVSDAAPPVRAHRSQTWSRLRTAWVVVPVHLVAGLVSLATPATDAGPLPLLLTHGAVMFVLLGVVSLTGVFAPNTAAVEPVPSGGGEPEPAGQVLDEAALRQRMIDLGGAGVDFAVVVTDPDDVRHPDGSSGIDVAERALELLAGSCVEALRPDDVVGRIGATKLVMLLPRTAPTHAARALDRVRSTLVSRLGTEGSAPFTCSFGISSSLDGHTPGEMLAVAHPALDQAHAGGSERIVIAGSTVDPAVDDDLPLG